MTKAFFVTGTDTEVGKTHATCALLRRARQEGFSAVGLKPVAAGTDATGQNEDVARLLAASSLALPERIRNPWRFRSPIAPHLAAQQAGEEIRFAPILAAVETARQAADYVFVEGVGGFRVPLGPDGDSADLAQRLGLPVLLVVGLRLGCINHALLTAEAIKARGLSLVGWIANSIAPHMPCRAENHQTLLDSLPPCLGLLPHAPPDIAASHLALPGEGSAVAMGRR
ncbi:MAG: dethiobiotin synthase [Zoogloeaceae bacterium]|jgi:dethiobiotin synthetase|nr:dethiobiotin synthase [Zoogloeaceae bacterium]